MVLRKIVGHAGLGYGKCVARHLWWSRRRRASRRGPREAFFAPSRSILMEVPKIRALVRGKNLSEESANGETWSLCDETLSASDETLSANDVCGETLTVNDETGGAPPR